MISKLTRLNIVDNSGARSANCICILGKRRKLATVGDELVVSIRSSIVSKRVAKGTVCGAVLIRQKRLINRHSGVGLHFRHNAIVLIDFKDKMLFGSRIRGPVTQELRIKNYLRIICLAPNVI
jgi:large subunit ribosomal protein L14